MKYLLSIFTFSLISWFIYLYIYQPINEMNTKEHLFSLQTLQTKSIFITASLFFLLLLVIMNWMYWLHQDKSHFYSYIFFFIINIIFISGIFLSENNYAYLDFTNQTLHSRDYFSMSEKVFLLKNIDSTQVEIQYHDVGSTYCTLKSARMILTFSIKNNQSSIHIDGKEIIKKFPQIMSTLKYSKTVKYNFQTLCYETIKTNLSRQKNKEFIEQINKK